MIRSYSKNHLQKGGYTLLFAVLVASLVLAVGISILNISRKELILTAGQRQSGYAFYAADAGYECAVYWDFQGAFTVNGGTPATSVNCGQTTEPNVNGTPAGVPVQEALGNDPSTDPTSFSFSFQVPAPANASSTECAVVTVVQTPASQSAPAMTDIYSQGYNTGWTGPSGNCSGAGSNKVERELHATY